MSPRQRIYAQARAFLVSVLTVAACILVSPYDGWTHDSGTTGYAKISVEGRSVRYLLKIPAQLMSGLPSPAAAVASRVAIEADGMPCAPVPDAYHVPTGQRETMEIGVLYACAKPVHTLTIIDRFDEMVGPDHHTIADIEWPGGNAKGVFEKEQRRILVMLSSKDKPQAAAPAQPAKGPFLSYLGIGIEHILLGFDHLLFVLALVLPGGNLRALLLTVTAFTLAHSITLALSVLGIVMVPARIVEPLIALSIAYVGFENVYLRQALSRRWAVASFFGLVHGFGFAGALIELGLPASGLAVALLGFNLGVEAGQALVIILVLPLLVWLQWQAWGQRFVKAASLAIVAAGLALLVQRLMA